MTHLSIIKLDGPKGREQTEVAAHSARSDADALICDLLGSRSRRPASNLRNYEVMVLTRRQALALYRQLRAALYAPHK